MPLTQQQIQQNINAMAQQGATQADIKGYIDSLGVDFSQPQQPSPTPSASYPGMTGNVVNISGNVVKGVGSFLGNVGTGIGKGVTSTAFDIGSLGLQGIAGVVNAVHPGAIDASLTKVPEPIQSQLQPQGVGQQIGYTGEKIGEFFVPGGAEKSVFEKGAAYIDKLPEAIGLTGKAADALTGTLKIALRSGITGASTAGVTAAQGGNMSQVKGAAGIGALAGGAGQALELIAPGISKALQKSGFKLSPAQETKVSAKADAAAKFMTDNKILGSDETKYTKLTSLNKNLENTLQSSLPKNVQIPKQEIIDSINNSMAILKKEEPAIYKQALNESSQAIELLQSEKGKTIGIGDALSSKRSYGTKAFKQSKLQVRDPSVASEGSYAVEQAFQKGINDTLNTYGLNKINIPENLKGMFGGKSEVTLQEFNKVYSNAITSKNLTNLARFKKDSGLIGRLFGLWAGESLGQTIAPGLPGKIIGGAAGEMLSTRIPGIVRNIGERTLNNPLGKTVGATKVIMGTQSQ